MPKMKYDNIFISLEEASILEGITHEGIRIRIARNPKKYNIKK